MIQERIALDERIAAIIQGTDMAAQPKEPEEYDPANPTSDDEDEIVPKKPEKKEEEEEPVIDDDELHNMLGV